jgi:succinate-acetate transporter protein
MSVDSASILSVALQAVAAKVVVIIGLLMVFGLFCWAMFLHDLIALAVAGAFALVVFLPVLFRVLGVSNAQQNGS